MYNQIYGKFSQGTGSWLKNKDFVKFKNLFVNKEILETYEVQIMQDLLRINKLRKIKNMSVLDVGSGRQALAFETLSAKKIELVDISEFNVNRFQNYKRINQTKIVCKRFDICSKKFLDFQSNYDLIYLHGIIQHTKNPVLAIRNLVKKLNNNGILWFYFYQLGSSKNIYLQLQRDIFKNSSLTLNYFKNFNFKNLSNIEIDGLFDDIWQTMCIYCHQILYFSLF
jgi:SAM-dependent methyltransferase